MKKDPISSLSKNEKWVWDMVCGLRGIVLRKQLLMLLSIIHDLDPIASSNAISILMKLKLIESKPATPGSNARMLCLTRRGKALYRGKDSKSVSSVTDTTVNNLRSIYKVDYFINELRNYHSKDKIMDKYGNIGSLIIFKAKNDAKEMYAAYTIRFKDYFKMPDLNNNIATDPLDTFNLYTMMSREFYQTKIGINENTLNVAVAFFSLRNLNSSSKVKSLYDSMICIYFMFKRYFYQSEYNDMKLNLIFQLFLFDKLETKYARKRIVSNKLLKMLSDKKLLNYGDKIEIQYINSNLEEKYHVKRMPS